MARFEYTKTIEQYNFTPPESISEVDFIKLKIQIRENPNSPLINETKVSDSHDKLVIVVIIGIILLIIGLFGMFSTDNPPAWSVILMLISVFGVIHPIINMGKLQSSQNKVAADKSRVAYFKDLKKIVEESSDYRIFKSKYEFKYKFKYKFSSNYF
jgi:hypothetical protein